MHRGEFDEDAIADAVCTLAGITPLRDENWSDDP
jgi:hypothetical protein